MLFAHGFGCDQHVWRAVVPAFEDGWRVVLFDHVGAGRSDLRAYDPDRYTTLDGYATDVLEICDALDLSDVVFVGYGINAPEKGWNDYAGTDVRGKTVLMATDLKVGDRVVVNIGAGKAPLTAKAIQVGAAPTTR